MPQIVKGSEQFLPDGTANITRVSVFSKVERTMNMPVTQAQFSAWRNGQLIQVAMPLLDKEQREFIMTGMNQEEWDEMCKESDEEYANTRL